MKSAQNEKNKFFLIFFKKGIDKRIGMCYNSQRRKTDGLGSIAQLGEHLPYKQGVTGSSPVVSTIWPGSSVG